MFDQSICESASSQHFSSKFTSIKCVGCRYISDIGLCFLKITFRHLKEVNII